MIYYKNFILKNSFYVKTYSWQILSLLTNFISLFIILPYLTTNKFDYNIFVLFASVTLLMNYFDFGTSQATHAIAGKLYNVNFKEFKKSVLTYIFLLSLIIILIIILLTIGYKNPNFYFKDINTNEFYKIKYYFLITIFTIPQYILLKFNMILLGIHLKEYLIYKNQVISNIFRLLIVLIFIYMNFNSIIYYFLSIQLLTLLFSYTLYFKTKKITNIYFSQIFNIENISKKYLLDITKFSFVTFLNIISFILIYELDIIFISKKFGISSVGDFGVAFSLLAFFRLLFGFNFSPFMNKRLSLSTNSNHMDNFNYKIIFTTAPLVIFIIISFFLNLNDFIYSWVGPQFTDSIKICSFLIFINIFAFISYPISETLILRQNSKYIILLSLTIPIIYWSSILILQNYFSYFAIVISKLFIFFIYAFIYSIYIFKSTNIKIKNILIIFIQFIIPILILFILNYYFPIINSLHQKNKYLLFLTLIKIIFYFIFSFFILITFSKFYRVALYNNYKKLLFNDKI